MAEKEMSSNIHVLAIPFPLQGHINPMVQFSKLLISRGIKVTFVTTATFCNMLMQTQTESIAIESTPDVSIDETKCIDHYDILIQSHQASISSGLRSIVEKMENSSCPVNFIACDSYMPWALDLGHQLGLKGMAIATQSVAVAALYYHFQEGTLRLHPKEEEGGVISLPFLPTLVKSDLPAYISDPNKYPHILELHFTQNRSLLVADWFLFNTFDMLEDEVNVMQHQIQEEIADLVQIVDPSCDLIPNCYTIIRWATNQWKIKTIGPMIPSKYVGSKLDNDKDYGLNLFRHADNNHTTQWLDSKDPASVVYVSFGSLVDVEQDQMQEVALGLANSQCNFLWVVRESEESKLPGNFLEEVEGRGLIVNWCSQLEILAHPAVGCFLTHCGWNSTLEALSSALPLVAMPQWVEQPTNAKFIVDIWQVGVRVKEGENGLVDKGEVERCVKEVMEGERRKTLQENALKWKKLSNEGGSSEKNIEKLILEMYKQVFIQFKVFLVKTLKCTIN